MSCIRELRKKFIKVTLAGLVGVYCILAMIGIRLITESTRKVPRGGVLLDDHLYPLMNSPGAKDLKTFDRDVMFDGNVFPPFVAENHPWGIGEYGRPVNNSIVELNSKEGRVYYDGLKKNSFNQLASDLISVTRRLPDAQPPGCRNVTHQTRLQASVIICFHNEAWSVLLRSVHSVINRSPPELLKEVLLVDDASDMGHLGLPLELYMARLGVVRVVRTVVREGLIRARLLGYSHATGQVLVFLDSHIECFPGWLEPLLDRIAENPLAMPYPTITSIDASTLAIKPDPPRSVGSFTWVKLLFRWIRISELRAGRPSSPAEPIKSATMPGGLFAISRDFFTNLGTYDSEMDFWGGENLEISFKVWMCGGVIEVHPCSHVGHIFRHNNPIKWSVSGTQKRNSARVAEVWMDGYKEFFWESVGGAKADIHMGNISERVALRKSLNCHNFDWYMKNVLPELNIPTDCRTIGEIRNIATSKCIATENRKNTVVKLNTCAGHGGSQFWCLNEAGHIWNYYQYLAIDKGVVVADKYRTALWTYNEGKLRNTETDQCLTVDNMTIVLQDCSDSPSQQWRLSPRSHELNLM